MSSRPSGYRAVPCGRATRTSTSRLVLDVMRGEGFVAGPGSEARLSFARRRCPASWRRVAYLAALPTAGLALGLLLVKREEHVTVQLEDSPQGLQVHLTGSIPAVLVTALEDAAAAPGQAPISLPAPLSAPLPVPSPALGPWSAMPTPMPEPMPSPLPVQPAPVAVPAARPAAGPVVAPSLPELLVPARPAAGATAGASATVAPVPAAADIGVTVVRPSARPSARPPASADEPPAVVLHPDWGPPLRPGRHGLMGRDPQPDPSSPAAELVTVVDPDMSVSKTHLEFGVDVDGFWVRDRRSTNGTVVRGADGRTRPCLPGEKLHVEPGATVRLGGHSFTVQQGTGPQWARSGGVLPID